MVHFFPPKHLNGHQQASDDLLGGIESPFLDASTVKRSLSLPPEQRTVHAHTHAKVWTAVAP